MSHSLANALALLRETCAGLKASTDRADHAATLESMAVLIADLMATEANQGTALRAEIGAALGTAPASREEALRQAAARVAGADPGLLATLLAAERTGVNAANRILWDEQARPQRVEPPAVDDDMDLAALTAFLRRNFADEPEAKVAAASTVSRGMSKKTVLLELAGNRALPGVLVLRMDQSMTNYLGTAVADEYQPLALLWKHGARVAQPFAVEPTGQVLGEPFILSARVSGAAVGGNFVFPPRNVALVADFAACLAGIHAVPAAEFPGGIPSTPHIDGEIAKTYADWQALDTPSAVMEAGFRWVRENQHLGYGPPAVAHNDFNFNNLLVEGDRVTAVVDWEFVHVGTAAADLGYFYFGAENVSSFAGFCDAYVRAGGALPLCEQVDFYILWGQLRLGVLAFQAAHGLDSGTTTNIRFGVARTHRRLAVLRVAERLAKAGWLPPEGELG